MHSPTVSAGAASPLPTASDTTGSDELIGRYRHLCARGARKFVRPQLERSDLEQVAALGLVKAARRYDPSMRTPFEAFAWIAIVGELMHYVRDHEHAIRMPRKLASIERDAARNRDALVARLGREPRDEELAAALATTRTELERARAARASIRTISLDVASAEPAALALEDRLLIEDAFASLGNLERRIVGGVYLLGLTQRQLSKSLHLTPKRVSRIHRGALARMRRAWAS